MRKLYAAAAVILLMTACNSTPSGNAAVNPLDTAGLAEFQKQKQQGVYVASEIDSSASTKQTAGAAPAAAPATPRSSSTGGTASSGSSSAASGSGAASSGQATTKKKGWSKTAKGAVIGGVTGAAAGAVINKKNRAAGAVVGGVVGAAAGAIIGNEQDKKDGRH